MGRRVGSMLLLIAVLIAGLAPAEGATGSASSPTPDGDDVPVLHLRGESDAAGRYNFTTYPPERAVARAVDPFFVEAGRSAEWFWRMDRAPEAWALSAGTTIRLVVHFGALDNVLPSPGIPPQDDVTTWLRADARLVRGGTHDVVAHGETVVTHDRLAGEASQRAEFILEVPEDAAYNATPGDSPMVMLHVELHGIMRQDAPPTILTGATSADSHIVIPGFPIDAFRAWEAEYDCNALILEQQSCGEPTPATDDEASPVVEAPAGGLVLLAALGLLALRRARRSVPDA